MKGDVPHMKGDMPHMKDFHIPQTSKSRRLGIWTASLIVVACMIGTGIFTTTGLLVRDLVSPAAVLAAWLIGAVIALCGALSYGELVATMPENGGEYYFLSRIYHPAVGFVAAWISLLVGFSAPIAASAIAFGKYAGAIYPTMNPTAAATIIVLLLSAFHAIHVRMGGNVQNVFTLIKIVLIIIFIGCGIREATTSALLDTSETTFFADLGSPAFVIGIIVVSFAYSGWNGSSYIAGEVKTPSKKLPASLIIGTLTVALLYLGLNIVFLTAVPASEISGVVEVGHVAALRIFGPPMGTIFSGLIALVLVSSVSAMIMAGPRVYEAVGEDFESVRLLRYRTRTGGPLFSILLQAIFSIIMIWTTSFGALLTYIGFTLSICSGLTVLGVIVLRVKEPRRDRPYRTWGYPITPFLFICFSLWIIAYAIYARPVESAFGLATIVAGTGIYFLMNGRPLSDSKE
jgi:APA family basic amino acid/polyamine antiporter